jgi:hypothetical protein
VKDIRCALGTHRFRGWVAHTDGPCVFELEVHMFRQCERCPKMQHSFATIDNDPPVYRLDGGIPKRDLRSEASRERQNDDAPSA